MDILTKLLTSFERFVFQILGPAETGPYGPPTAPPAPRPRDARGVVLSARRLARLTAAAPVS